MSSLYCIHSSSIDFILRSCMVKCTISAAHSVIPNNVDFDDGAIDCNIDSSFH